MECSCDRPKVFHITELQSGNIEIFNLCEVCMQSYIKNNSLLPIQSKEQMVKNIISAFEEIIGNKKPAQELCKCGMTLEDVVQKGKLGCANCYEHFEKNLEVFFQNFQAGTKHIGKVPKRHRRSPEDINKKLQDLMNECIEKENYEMAAKLRDSINKLKNCQEQIVLDECFDLCCSIEDSFQ